MINTQDPVSAGLDAGMSSQTSVPATPQTTEQTAPQIVQFPNGDKAQFPSDMSKEKIQSIIDMHIKDHPEALHAPTTLDKVASSALAATGGAVQGALKGVGQTLEAGPNLAGAVIQGGLDLLNKAGIVPDSLSQGFQKGRTAVREAVENAGQKVLDFQGQPSAADQAANPMTSKVSNVLGNIAGSSVAAGGIVGNLGKGMNAITAGILNQGAQGALMGASGDAQNPLAGATVGATIGGVLGGVAGKLDRSTQIINDKIDDAERIGLAPMSEAGIKSIKGALDSNGKELTIEEVEKATKTTLQKTLDAAAPQVDISQKPADMITNMATTNFKDVEKIKNDLYAPLNNSEAPTTLTNLNTVLSNPKLKYLEKVLPDDLPENPSLSDLMTYRRNVGAEITQAERALSMGTGNYKTLKALNAVKQAVTDDLNTSAEAAGLGGQLQKADSYYLNNYKPFEVFDTTSGKLKSPTDIRETWTKVSKLLRPRMPNLESMNEVGDSLNAASDVGEADLGGMAKAASTLGPQGKQVFGYAYLQQAMERSMNVDGRIFPGKISAELNKLENSGLGEHILTPQLKEAFNGMRNIAEGALKTTRGMDAKGLGAISNFVNSCTHNTAGINLLRILGSKTAPQSQLKNIISQILLNAAEQGAGASLPQTPLNKQQ